MFDFWHKMKQPLFFWSNAQTKTDIIWAAPLFIHSFPLSLPCCCPLSRNNSVSTPILDCSLSFPFVLESAFSSKGHWWPQRITWSGIQSNCIILFIPEVLSVLWKIWYRAEPCRSGSVPLKGSFQLCERSGEKAFLHSDGVNAKRNGFCVV